MQRTEKREPAHVCMCVCVCVNYPQIRTQQAMEQEREEMRAHLQQAEQIAEQEREEMRAHLDKEQAVREEERRPKKVLTNTLKSSSKQGEKNLRRSMHLHVHVHAHLP